MCKIAGCKSCFSCVRDWNSHHRQTHPGHKLTCKDCNKTFKTPSFLRDHAYEHSKCAYTCDKCDKHFAFKSVYRIHVRTHLRSWIHRCFAGTCKCEYKWPQDLHRHIQTHLKYTYGCNVCDYASPQKYLLKRHLKKHSDKSYYNCDKCDFVCKWYTQLKRHSKKCSS